MYALRVIEGKMRGRIIDLPGNSELVVGRGSTFDVVIDEDMVSRRHAKITTFHDGVTLQDLNSTNGTLVNQHRLQGLTAQRLKAGDQIGVGTCVLELIQTDGVTNTQALSPPEASPPIATPVASTPHPAGHFDYNNNQGGYAPQPPAPQAPQTPQPPSAAPLTPPQPNQGYAQPPSNFGAQGGAANPAPPANRAYTPQQSYPGAAPGFSSLAGARPRSKMEVGTFPSNENRDVLNLIEKLIERRHDGVLAVFDPEEREGNIYFRGGHIYFVTLEDPHRIVDHPFQPIQGMTRVCGWGQGRFKIKPMSALPQFENEISDDSRSLLEQVRQSCIELNSLRAQLPPLDVRLQVPAPLNPPLSALSSEQLDALQMCFNQADLRTVIDYHPHGERDGIKTMLQLLESGYLISR